MTDAHPRRAPNFHVGHEARRALRIPRRLAMNYIVVAESSFRTTPVVLRDITRLACLRAVPAVFRVCADPTEPGPEFAARCDETVRVAAADVVGEARLALLLCSPNDAEPWNRFVGATLASVVRAADEEDQRLNP